MGKVKVCRGCFAEMDEESEECPLCGWRSGKTHRIDSRWELGKVLEKRYLIGDIFFDSEEEKIVVYRSYDHFLQMPCMLLISLNNEDGDLYKLAVRLSASPESESKSLVIQALKKIDGEMVLVFSLANRYMQQDKFHKILVAERNTETQDLIVPAAREQGRDELLPIGYVIAERYHILDFLGVGGFGITYLCEDIFLHRYVAVKEYFPDEWAVRDESYVVVRQSAMLQAYQYGMQCFKKEIGITAKFIHTPHIVTIFDAAVSNDTLYMVMEYVPGISMGREMRARAFQPFSAHEVANMMMPVLDALEEMHEKKIIHSDISPGNILHTNQGGMCLIDMGAAKYKLDTRPSLSAIFLKIEYAAPEQYQTAKEGKPSGEGPWTDIYALGATMYYLLTGTKPTDAISRLGGKDTNLVHALSGKIPVFWAQLLQNAMALEKRDRIQSVAELREKIEAIAL